MKQNPNLAAEGMPPEFRFKPTTILYDEPPGNIIYEDAMGSSGKAPLDPRLQRGMDPIHWSRGKGIQNMQRTAEGLISHLTHTHAVSQTPRTIMRKHQDKQTVNTFVKEPPGARQPRVKGYRTPQQVARGAKMKDFTTRPQGDPDKMAMITDPRRGFRPQSRSGFMQWLSQRRPETVDALARRMERREEKLTGERIRVGGSEFTQAQIAAMPAGYMREMIRRQRLRETKMPKPPVAFDPRESKGLATHGEYTKLARPGLVKVGEGKYVRPSQLGIERDVAIGRLGNNAQPKAGLSAGEMLFMGGAVVAGLLGVLFLVK